MERANPARMTSAPPSGTVCFLFTDIEGSTKRWESNAAAMAVALRRHDEFLKAAIECHRGFVFKTAGDAFCAAFETVPQAVRAAHQAQVALLGEDFGAVDGLRVRMAVHAGSAEARDNDYFGPALNKIARLLHAGHGEQILLTGSAAQLLADALDDGFSLSPLGKHRLKDLETPEQVYQLKAPGLRSDFPTLRTLDAQPHNLPVALTSFIGREKEVRTLSDRLQHVRLLTLLGTGGVGKTRLALQVAADVLDRFADGAWLVELAPLSSAELVATETATVLGVRAEPGETPAAAIVDFLSDRKALLVFDSCEHVIPGVAGLTQTILQNCSGVRTLSTSRQALEVGGEIVHAVGTLDVPSADVRAADQAMRHAAVALFVERARAVSSSFEIDDGNAHAIVTICRRLDGIALALELAAARSSVMSPRTLLERLDERFRLLTHGARTALPRQQTLRSLIDWSYDLLDERERQVFRTLSIFSGGWTLEAASAVCAHDELDEWDVIDLLSSLVAKSLVSVELSGDEKRYRLLDSIREYAAERCRDAGESESAAQRHAAYFARFLDGHFALAEVEGDDAKWRAVTVPEKDNLRAALTWSAQSDKPLQVRLLAALAQPHLLFDISEALALFETGVSVLNEKTPPAIASRALRYLSRLQWIAGRPIAAREESAALAIAAALRSGDGDELAYARLERARLLRESGRLDEADAEYSAAYEAIGKENRRAMRSLLRAWAITDLERHETQRARDRFAENARIEVPGSEGYGFALMNLAEAEFALGRVEEARTVATRAKQTLVELNHVASLGSLDCNLAAYAMETGDLESARVHLHDALGVLKESGADGFITTAIEHIASLAARTDQWPVGATLLGYTERQYSARGRTRERTEQRGYERLTATLREHLESAELERLLREGGAFTTSEALALAASIHNRTIPAAFAAKGEE